VISMTIISESQLQKNIFKILRGNASVGSSSFLLPNGKKVFIKVETASDEDCLPILDIEKFRQASAEIETGETFEFSSDINLEELLQKV